MDKTYSICKKVLSAIPGILNYNVEVPKLDPCQLCGQEFIPHPASEIKEFTMASCGCLYHQKNKRSNGNFSANANASFAEGVPLFSISEDMLLFPASPKKRITESVSVETTAKKVKKQEKKKQPKKNQMH
ncbi:2443_t:CDS:2 [Ambispora gerdemannii]|uniref:2443_t:CDS:1 n=1 Tax=Ambispora gerdemannii TaxID=144530 RepID=A0A9N9D760_9GLOM|nr:2443_t:CDS:2 [Ambispora gerdemannii]